ncbi:hypothetical protein VTK73DRAFT_5035 [Phialemonium thermophilum]|uniref:Uncharacterized protein n=1 Tax=Phialemonium thermophilum TaxID=223376 RepID=A0ABR3V444_9PEZI
MHLTFASEPNLVGATRAQQRPYGAWATTRSEVTPCPLRLHFQKYTMHYKRWRSAEMPAGPVVGHGRLDHLPE